MNILIAIPARLESTRLPRKLLLAETGKPLIQHTVDAARVAASHLREGDHSVSIALLYDSPETYEAWSDRLECMGWQTSQKHTSGTERICSAVSDAEVVGGLFFDLICGIQADEPEIKPEHIEELIRCATEFPTCDMATLASVATKDDQHNPNVVKVRRGVGGFAETFSRSPTRGGLAHIGIYAYTPAFLRQYVAWKPTANEQLESLEQLRALDHGCRIRVGLVDHPYRGIDTRADYDAFVKRQNDKSQTSAKA